jgi:hypothetical protein
MQRSGREFQIDWPNWLIIILLLIGVFVLTTADAAGLMGTPHIAIDVRAEPIAAFDKHNSSRIRFGQLEFRGGLTLSSSYWKFGGLSAIRLAPDGAHFISVNDHGRWFRGTLIYEEARPAGIADAIMAPILGPDGQPRVPTANMARTPQIGRS